jgi:hypothetical protein
MAAEMNKQKCRHFTFEQKPAVEMGRWGGGKLTSSTTPITPC